MKAALEKEDAVEVERGFALTDLFSDTYLPSDLASEMLDVAFTISMHVTGVHNSTNALDVLLSHGARLTRNCTSNLPWERVGFPLFSGSARLAR